MNPTTLPWIRRVLIPIVLGVSLVASTLVASPAAAQQIESLPAEQPQELTFQPQILAAPEVAVWPGGLAALNGAILNPGTTEIDGPVELTFDDLPDGFTFAGIDVATGVDEFYSWRCDETSRTITCTLFDLDGAETALLGESLATWRVTLAVDPDVRAGAMERNGTPIAGPAAVTVSAAGADVLIAPTQITLLPPDEGAAPIEFRATAPYESDHELPIETSFSLTNLSSTALDAGTISIVGAVPPGALDWVATGSGWTCADDDPTAASPICRWTAGPLGRGESTGTLTIETTHAALSASEVVDGRALAWTAEVVVAGDSPMSLSRPLETTLALGATPSGSIVAEATDALVVVAPTTFEVTVDVLANWLDNATGPVSVSVALPEGMTLEEVDLDDWRCEATTGNVQCDFVGTPEVVGDVEEAASDLALPLSLAVSEATEIGAHEVVFDLEIPGELAEDVGDNRTAISIVVSEKPEPVLSPTLHQDGAIVRDGSPLRLEAGTSFGVGAENLGSSEAEAGDTVTLRLLAASGLTLQVSDSAWSCDLAPLDAEPFALGTWHTCEHVLEAELLPDGVLEPVTVDVVDVARGHGAVSVPMEMIHGDAPAVDRVVRGIVGPPAEVAGPVVAPTPVGLAFATGDPDEDDFIPQGVYSGVFAVPDVSVWFSPGAGHDSFPAELCDAACSAIVPVTPNAEGTRVLAGQQLEALYSWTTVGMTATGVGTPTLYFERWEVCDAAGCTIATDRKVTPPIGSTSVTAVYYAKGPDLAPPSPVAAGLVTIGKFTVTWDVDTLAVVAEPSTSAAVEGEITSFTSGTYSPDGTTSDVRWERCDDAVGESCIEIDGATGSSYTPTFEDAGKHLRAAFTVNSSLGIGRFTTQPTLVQPLEPSNTDAPGLVRSEPSPGVQRWTATPGSWTNLADETFAYEFQFCSGSDCSTVQTSSATNTYEPTIDDFATLGADLPDLRVVVRAINRPGTASEVISSEAASSPTPLVALEPVVITTSSTELIGSTSPIVGTTVRAVPPTWAWSEPASVTWQSCTSGTIDSPNDCVVIPSEDDLEFALTSDEIGAYVRPVFLGSNPWHDDVSHVGSAVGPVATTTPQVLAPVSAVAGSPQPGDTIVAVAGTWSANEVDPLLPASDWSYQWQRCSSALSSSCADLSGETNQSFTVRAEDDGYRVRVVETVRTVAGAVATSTSSMTAPVAAPPDTDPSTDATPDGGQPDGAFGVCDVVDAVGASGSTVALSDRLSLDLGTWSASSTTCGASTTVDFRGAGFTLDGAIELRNARGTIAGSTVRFSAGSVSIGGDGFAGLSFGLGPDGLTIDLGAAAVAGDVVADGLAGLGMPSGWTGATRVRFSVSGTRQNIEVFGVAHVPTSSFVPTADGLPDPSGIPVARVVGSLDSAGDLRLGAEVNGLIDLGGAKIDLVGSVVRAGSSGPVQVEVAGTLASPVDLSTGMALTWAELRWADGEVAGSATITIGSAVLSGTVSYRSATDWTVGIAVDRGGEPITLAPEFTLPSPSVQGDIVRTSAGFEATVVATVDRWEVGNGSGLVFDDASFTIEHRCLGTTRCQTSLALSAGVTVDLGAGAIEALLDGTIDSSTGDFEVRARLDTVPTPPGLDVTEVSLVVQRVDGELSTDVRSEIVVLGSVVEGSLSFDNGDTTFTASLDRWTPIPDGPEFSEVELTYSSNDFTVVRDGVVRSFDGRTLAVSATIAAPGWLSDLVGAELETSATGSIDLESGSLSLTSPLDDLAGTEIFDVAGVGLSLGDVELQTSATASSVTQRLAGDVEFTAPSFGLGSDIELVMVISAEGRGGPSGGFSATISLPEGQGWSDAFGVSGLDIDRLALSLAVSPAGSTIGMAGEVSLPGSMTEPLGIREGTPVLLAATIGAGPQCFAFSIGDGDHTAIDVLGLGLITASEASLVLAPAGCEIGDFVFAPGVSFAFDGNVFGVDVEVSVAFDPIARALAADLVVGDIDLAGVSIEGVELHLESSPGDQRLEFAGSLELFGARATVEGRFESSPAGADIQLRALFEDMTIGGFGIDELDVTVQTADAMTSVSVDARGDIALLGSDVFVTLAVEFEQGLLQRAEGTGQLDTDLSGLSLDLTVGFEFVPDQFPTIDFVGQLELAGLEMASVDGHISRRGATLNADLEIPGLLDARVGGWIAFPHGEEHPSRDGTLLVVGGVPDDAEPGDFRIYAEDITIGIAGFGLRADVEAELIQGNPRVSLNAQLQLGTSSAVGGTVTLTGTVDGQTGITLEGTGSVIVAEHELVDGEFSAAVQPDGQASVSLRASIDLGGGDAELDGSFERGSRYGTLFRLYGRSTVSAGSFDFSDVELLAVRDVPKRGASRKVTVPSVNRADPLLHPDCVSRGCSVRFGFVGSATLAAPAIGEVEVDLGFSADSIAFSAKVRLSGPAGDALGNPRVVIGFDSNVGGVSVLSFRVRVGSRWGVPLGFVVDGAIRSDGSASFDATARMRGHWELNIPFFPAEVKFWTRPYFRVGFDFDIQDPSALDIRASIDAGLAVLVQWVSFAPEPWRTGWTTVLNLRVQGSTRPTYLRVSASVGRLGTVSVTFR